MLVLIRKPRDISKKAGSKRLANAKVRDLRSESQRDPVQSPNQEVLGYGAKT